MKLVGFGCSFTYGSELIDPEIDEWDQHYSNRRYRESHVWLGLLAERFGCTFDNRAEPANSNYAIAQQVTEYLNINQNHLSDVIICVAYTERTRMSWYDGHWTHNGFAKDKHDWELSAREWIIRSTDKSHDMFTENAKLIVNSVCKYYNTPLVQFNALGTHKIQPYTNYLANGITMDGWLKQLQKERNKTYFASGGHPNEAGHYVWVDEIMNNWIKSNNLL